MKMKHLWNPANIPAEQLKLTKTQKKNLHGKHPGPTRYRGKRPNKALWKWLRWKVLTRDRFRCQYCGKDETQVLLQVDHIQPICRGGSNRLINLVTACQPCNSDKFGRKLNPNAKKKIQAGIMERYHAALQREREEQERYIDFRLAMERDS